MSKRKILHINTGMFSLDIYYNGVYVGAQVTIFIGLAAMRIFAQNDAVHKMCTVFFIIDMLALLIIFFNGASVSLEDASAEKDAPAKEDLNVEVEHKKSEEKKEEKPKKGEKEKEQVIKNKVPIPVQAPPKPEVNADGFQKMEDMDTSDWADILASMNAPVDEEK